MSRYPLARWLKNIYPDSSELPIEKRVFIGIPAIAFGILMVFALMEFSMGNLILGMLDLTAMSILGLVYYLGRHKQNYRLAASIFALASYLLLAIAFFLNAGSNGPTLYLFLISFLMVIGLTPNQQHPWWLASHLLLALLMLTLEWWRPHWISGHYDNERYRMLDIYICFSASLIFIFLVIRYLRKNYFAERHLAQKRGEEIEKTSQKIESKNQKLRQLNAEKHRLLSVIAHDLRGPLGNMRSFVQMINAEQVSEQERRELQRDLMNLTNNAYMLLDNLLHWSNPAIKGSRAKLQVMELGVAIQQSLALLQPAAEAKGISLSYREADNHRVMANREMLSLIIRNLVSNAIKFTGSGGQIRLFSERSESGICLKVYDTGVGISAEQMPHLFEPEHYSSYGTQQESGVGLGLALCREYAEAMGGSISVESEIGLGSTFKVELQSSS